MTYVVGIFATQKGSRFARLGKLAQFDNERYLREVIEPVDDFLEKMGDRCKLVLIFNGSPGVDGEEAVEDDLPEQNVRFITPSLVAAEKYFLAAYPDPAMANRRPLCLAHKNEWPHSPLGFLKNQAGTKEWLGEVCDLPRFASELVA
jgi:hypothetical protein